MPSSPVLSMSLACTAGIRVAQVAKIVPLRKKSRLVLHRASCSGGGVTLLEVLYHPGFPPPHPSEGAQKNVNLQKKMRITAQTSKSKTKKNLVIHVQEP